MNEWRITYWDESTRRAIKIFLDDDPSGRGEHVVLETVTDLIRKRNIGITIGYYSPEER